MRDLILTNVKLKRMCRVYQARALREEKQRKRYQKAITKALRMKGPGVWFRAKRILQDSISDGPSH